MHPRTLFAAGQPVECFSTARSAVSLMPRGIVSAYRTRMRVIRSTWSTASISPSTMALILSGGAGILRTSSARASVPSSQAPTDATMWSSVAGTSSSGSTP